MPTSRRQQIQRLILPAVAGGCLIFAISAVIRPERTRADPPATPPTAAYASTVAGVGIIEPQSELIAVATEVPGVIRSVLVQPGDRVSQGQPLFRLDARAAEAAVATAVADAASAEAAARQAEVALADERQRLSLFEAIDDPRALSGDELERRRFAVRRAEAAAAQARASAAAARAQAQARRVDLDRLTVAAPIAGRVFRVDVRPGEYAPAGPTAQPLIAMGEDARLHVRAEFDEADAGRLTRTGRAYGTLRGQANRRIPLTLVRIEPQVVEKRALSGGSERVDTRVVEVLFAFDPESAPAYLGQRVDVFVEAAPSATQPATRPTEPAR
ncbi:efflux RND transporter periplasmic adaptor subunit [Brevundimonas sp.]|jgi:HlyD family secretion protein|uniref:efflux RND transporter periplasmic adaptor subunit n=1 Tax=Brevundimonas sp. TaxID=1871086 RepID=UPI003918A250